MAPPVSRSVRSPNWINSKVIAEALLLKQQGLLTPTLDRWIRDLLELDDQETSQAANRNQ